MQRGRETKDGVEWREEGQPCGQRKNLRHRGTTNISGTGMLNPGRGYEIPGNPGREYVIPGGNI